MTPVFQGLLIAGAVLTLVFILYNIYKSKLKIGDSLFWFGFSLILLVLAVFPSFADWLARLVGVKSTENMVFLGVIVVLVYREFRVTLRLSQLDTRLRSLVTKLAIDNAHKQTKTPPEIEPENKNQK